MSEAAPPLLSIDDVSLEFRTRSGTVRALQHVGLTVARGETDDLAQEPSDDLDWRALWLDDLTGDEGAGAVEDDDVAALDGS